jgi:AraC family transcriptional regulator
MDNNTNHTQPRFEISDRKRLVGKCVKMSFSGNRTGELWRSFMPRRKEILKKVGNELFSLQVYDNTMDFGSFNPNTELEKWALAEVTDHSFIPDGMQPFDLEPGLYAVFNYVGAASEGEKMFRYIFETWLPQSGYVIDSRPHFEILGEKYKNDDPESEEEIWIPVKPK